MHRTTVSVLDQGYLLSRHRQPAPGPETRVPRHPARGRADGPPAGTPRPTWVGVRFRPDTLRGGRPGPAVRSQQGAGPAVHAGPDAGLGPVRPGGTSKAGGGQPGEVDPGFPPGRTEGFRLRLSAIAEAPPRTLAQARDRQVPGRGTRGANALNRPGNPPPDTAPGGAPCCRRGSPPSRPRRGRGSTASRSPGSDGRSSAGARWGCPSPR